MAPAGWPGGADGDQLAEQDDHRDRHQSGLTPHTRPPADSDMELEPEAIDWLLFTSTAEQINELTGLAWRLLSRSEETVTVTVTV